MLSNIFTVHNSCHYVSISDIGRQSPGWWGRRRSETRTLTPTATWPRLIRWQTLLFTGNSGILQNISMFLVKFPLSAAECNGRMTFILVIVKHFHKIQNNSENCPAPSKHCNDNITLTYSKSNSTLMVTFKIESEVYQMQFYLALWQQRQFAQLLQWAGCWGRKLSSKIVRCANFLLFSIAQYQIWASYGWNISIWSYVCGHFRVHCGADADAYWNINI